MKSNILRYKIGDILVAPLLVLELLFLSISSAYSQTAVVSNSNFKDEFALFRESGEWQAEKTIYFFFNPFCPNAGKAFREIIPRLKEDFLESRKIVLAFVLIPLSDEKEEERALSALYCAEDQGRALQFASLSLPFEADVVNESLAGFAKLLRMDSPEFLSCLNHLELGVWLNNGVKLSQSLSLDGTPHFIFRGVELSPVDYATFSNQLRQIMGEINK